jgi:hypothetical protein
MEKLKGYRMPIFDDEALTREDIEKQKESGFKSFYLAVLSCNSIAYPSM